MSRTYEVFLIFYITDCREQHWKWCCWISFHEIKFVNWLFVNLIKIIHQVVVEVYELESREKSKFLALPDTLIKSVRIPMQWRKQHNYCEKFSWEKQMFDGNFFQENKFFKKREFESYFWLHFSKLLFYRDCNSMTRIKDMIRKRRSALKKFSNDHTMEAIQSVVLENYEFESQRFKTCQDSDEKSRVV